MKKKKRIKNILRIGFIFVLSMFLFQSLRFTIEKYAFQPQKNNKVSGNYRSYVSDNYTSSYGRENYIGNSVLVHKENGLSSFPFLFGNRLYLYDIEKDTFQYIAGTWYPYTSIGWRLITADNKVYYTVPRWTDSEDSGNMYSIDLKTKKTNEVPEDVDYFSHPESAVYKDKIYYKKEYIEEDKKYRTEDYGSIFVTDLKTSKEEIFKTGEIDFFRVIGEDMYCYDRKTKKLSITNLASGKEEIKTPSKKEYGMLAYNYTERKGRLYYDDDEYHVKQIDIETNKEKIIIDLLDEEPFKSGKEYFLIPSISYCDDYIAVENYYYSDEEIGEHWNLFIYDYNGKLLKKKQLW